MDYILEFIRTDYFFIGISIFCIILFLLYLITLIKFCTIRKNYKKFMKNIGNGQDIQKTLEKYMEEVNKVKEENLELKNYTKQLDEMLSNCLQKVGLVRYSAFKDTGSDLSFALAILNEKNTGVVLNGIYSREMSNIYSKPVEKGNSTYTLSAEEKQAIEKAINEN